MSDEHSKMDDWLEVFAGREPSSGADPKLVREARFMRGIFRKQEESDEPITEEELRALLRKSIAQVEAGRADASQTGGAEGGNVVKMSPATAVQRQPRRWSRPLALAASIAAFAVFGTMLWRWQSPPGDQPIVRGVREGAQQQITVEVGDPAMAAQQAAEALRALGLTVNVSESEDLWMLETDVPASAVAQASQALKPFNVPELTSGHVEITFRLAL